MPLFLRHPGFEDYLDLAGGHFIKALVLGQQDAGKTRSASFWPRPIFADCEKGRMSISDRGSAVTYGEIGTSADMDTMLEMLKAEARKPVASRRWLTFVLDTLDSYQRKLIQERLASERKDSFSGWQDWGFLDAKMTSLLERMLNLPMNIVVNVHTKDHDEGDDSAKLIVKNVKLKGDIRDQIANEFDLVGHMEVSYVAEEGERVKKRQIRWHSEPKYPLLKDRSGRLPRFTDIDFTEADYTRIFEHIIGDHLKTLPKGEVVDELAVATDVEPEVAAKVGPVKVDAEAVKPPRKAVEAAAKKAEAAAKKAAEPKPGQATVEISGADVVPGVSGGTTSSSSKATKMTTSVPTQGATTSSSRAAVLEGTPDAVTEDKAVETVAAALGATPVDPAPEPAPVVEAVSEAPVASGPVCGSQPESFIGKYEAAPGCGASLADVPKDRLNISLVRTKTFLCEKDFASWKADH